MAQVIPLGAHAPSALQYLIDEGLLQRHQLASSYDWHCNSEEAEELLWTSQCVIYSKDGRIQRVYRFEPGERHGRHELSRALVIFAGKQCHIHFLAGSSYILGVPFEVERVFPAAEGLLIERRLRQGHKAPDHLPKPPPNSFRSTQPELSPFPKSPLGLGRVGLNFSLRDSPSSKRYSMPANIGGQPLEGDEDDLPHLFSLTDPLGDFCAVASATIAPLPRHMRANDTDFLAEYDDLDADERLVYVSRCDEVAAESSAETVAPLLFMVTRNDDLGQITIWQGWYFQPHSLTSVMTARNNAKLARDRRRSSFAQNAGIVGVQGPLLRFHDRGRESFAASVHTQNGKPSRKVRKAKSDGRSKPEDEESMRSRMDPDYQAAQNQFKGGRSRGSLLSRADLGIIEPSRAHVGQNPNFPAPNRRGPSLRMSQDRRSFGTSIYRKSRGSVAASSLGRSLGPDEDESMDLDSDSWIRNESDAEVVRTVQLFAATAQFSGLDPALAQASDGIRPEFIVRKVHVLTIPSSPHSPSRSNYSEKTKVKTLYERESTSPSSTSINMWIHVGGIESCMKVDIQVVSALSTLQHQKLGSSKRVHIRVPLHRAVQNVIETIDITKVRSSGNSALIALSAARLEVSPSLGRSWSVATPDKFKMFDTSYVRNDLIQSDRDFGMKRMVDVSNAIVRLEETWKSNQVCFITRDGLRLTAQLKLWPECSLVRDALSVVRSVLDGKAKESLMSIWISSCVFLESHYHAQSNDTMVEYQALLMTLLCFAIGSLGKPSQRTPRKLRRYQNRTSSDTSTSEIRTTPLIPTSRSKAWELVNTEMPPAKAHSRSYSSSPAVMTHTGVNSVMEFSFAEIEASTRSLLHDLVDRDFEWLMSPDWESHRVNTSLRILLAIQNFRVELTLTQPYDVNTLATSQLLAACVSQLGHYLQMPSWAWSADNHLEGELGLLNWDFSGSTLADTSAIAEYRSLTSFSSDRWRAAKHTGSPDSLVLDLQAIANLGKISSGLDNDTESRDELLPRSDMLEKLANVNSTKMGESGQILELAQRFGLTVNVMETMSEASIAQLREAVAGCQDKPPSTWPMSLLRLIGREDLSAKTPSLPSHMPSTQKSLIVPSTDLQAIITQAERLMPLTKSYEADRHAVILQIFTEDRRFVDAARLMNPSILQVAECPPRAEWSDIDHLDQQKRVMQWVMTRTIALSAGNAMVHFESQKPLISEKFHVPGFSMLCQMKPMDNTVSADRTGFTEEKFSWAFFHSGTSAGLHISRNASGIDTSWILFNKPHDLTNRHAGFLLALGLNGHLKKMAKWLAFKYLTPKHTMTSVGLLLGLSASHMGTMDSLVTRMLSVHITRMLPPGAAELNVSPLTQTAGLLGIGLLYLNTQHRRMSEMMLSELEFTDVEDAGSVPDNLRDESYRLAAGFALGLMNLGKGGDLRGLHGLNLHERLLSIAVGPRPVDLVHVIDKGTAGSIVALAFIYIKSNDASVAKKIDVPDTLSQIDYVRPDALLLRSLAKNLIMWDAITDEPGWIRSQLPTYCPDPLTHSAPKTDLRSSNIPTYNILTGHAWALSLRYAGSGSVNARDEILGYFDLLWTVSKQHASYYDALLALTTVRRCVDLLALSAATVMAGTGDLVTLRYLRRLHGRTDDQTTYGSHMAAHLAIGTLFLGGGTYTFGTSNLAVASLVIAFYPLFPGDILDNAVHLQAFRHLWVLAAEARCAIIMDIDSQRPITTSIKVKLKSGQEKLMKAPCLLPELTSILSLETVDPSYWHAKLDFENNKDHLKAFQINQTLIVRKAPSASSSPLLFNQTLNSMNEAQNKPSWYKLWFWLLRLPTFEAASSTEIGLVIPGSSRSLLHHDERTSVLDDRLSLWTDAVSWDAERLGNVRSLLKWAAKRRLESDGKFRWLGNKFVEEIEAAIERRMVEVYEEEVA
ncbi:hypothetical protein ANO11243_012630 [Dothideomycetidae sp. 11243]|nr:hypothetical protein ANO11243_012630 [fungal sp. No.11243]